VCVYDEYVLGVYGIRRETKKFEVLSFEMGTHSQTQNGERECIFVLLVVLEWVSHDGTPRENNSQNAPRYYYYTVVTPTLMSGGSSENNTKKKSKTLRWILESS
jgi:hypothetical protein